MYDVHCESPGHKFPPVTMLTDYYDINLVIRAEINTPHACNATVQHCDCNARSE